MKIRYEILRVGDKYKIYDNSEKEFVKEGYQTEDKYIMEFNSYEEARSWKFILDLQYEEYLRKRKEWLKSIKRKKSGQDIRQDI